MSKPEAYLVSVLLPVYNVEPYIEKCCRSLFGQTYDNIEFVFVDDCSTDKSIAILKNALIDFPEREPAVKILRHERNSGQATGRNTALKNAQGEYVVFVDADDWIEKDAIRLLVDKQIETGADIVYGQMIAHYASHEEYLLEPHYASKAEMVRHATELTIDHSLCKRLYRKSLFCENQIGCVDGWDYGEDHYLLPQLYWYANCIERIEDVIYHYNCWKSGKASPPLTTIWKMWSNELNIIDALLLFFADKDSDCVESLKHTKVACLMSCLGQSYAHRTRKKYNQLAAVLYAMPKPYFSKAQFCRPHEYVLYRFYDSRLIYRAIVKVLSKMCSMLKIAG